MIVRRSLFFPILRFFVLLVIGLLVAFVVALSRVDLETLRGSLVGVLRDASGLPIQVDGAVSWKFSVRPQVELNEVRILNADWAKEKYAYSADKMIVRLNLLSLFRDRPTIQNVKIYDVDINIEQNASGQYSVQPIANKDTKKIADESVKVQEKYPLKQIGFGGIEIKNLRANILNNQFDLAGFNVRMIQRTEEREYSGWIKVESDVKPFIVVLQEYNSERKIYPVQVAVSTHGGALIANIALEGTSKMPIDFKIKGEGPNFVNVGKFLGIDMSWVPTFAVNIAGGFDRGKITLRKSLLSLSGIDFTVSGVYDFSKNNPVIKLDVKSDYVNLITLFPHLYHKNDTKQDLNNLDVFKDIPLYGTLLLNKTIDLNLDFGEFVMYRDLDISNLKLHLIDKAGHVRVDSNLGFAGGEVEFALDADVDTYGHIWATLGFVGKKVLVGDLLQELDVDDFVSDLPVDVKVFVQANGKNLSQMMQTVSGPVYLYSVGSGYAHSALVSYMYGTDFLTSLRHGIQDLFRSEKKYDQIKISCLALNGLLRNGLFKTENGFAIETNAINIRLAGTLDLGQETMGLSLTAVPVRGLKLSLTGNVVNSIELTGVLAQPEIKISGAAVAGKVASATGLGLLLAPFTGGISLVAGAGIGLVAGDLLENWLADSNPCETALKRGAPLYNGDPEWFEKPVDDLINNILSTK